MNQAHFHLLVNHLPIIGTLIGMLTLLAGFALKNTSTKRVALGIFIFAAVSAVPAYFSGEGAEEIAEEIPGVTEAVIEEHEEVAAIFIWMTSALGIISLLTLLFDLREKSASKVLYVVTVLLSLGSMIVAQQVGVSGGEIRHTEIRTGSSAGSNDGTDVAGQQNEGVENEEGEEDDDDD